MTKIILALSIIALTALVVVVEDIPAIAQDEVAVGVNVPGGIIPDSDFTVRIVIGTVTDFDAGQFDVSFDSTVLQFDLVTPATDGMIGVDTIPVTQCQQYPPGNTETYRIIVNVPGISGVTGSGYLAELHFHVIGSSGQGSVISLSNGFLNNNLAQEITTTWIDDSVTVYEELAVTTVTLPDGKVGNSYSALLAAEDGMGSNTWSVSSGSLPAGLSLNSVTGEISGTPTASGNSIFTIEVTDGVFIASQELSISVANRSGDANGDNELNTADITTIEMIITGQQAASSGSDANKDGLVNTADITKVERFLVGLD
ncbi:putative Ig domain-containing protein [Chloroflexota bacterium]